MNLHRNPIPRHFPADAVAPIARLDASEIGPGSLGRCFHDGAAAVVIAGDPAVGELWRRLTADMSTMPWTSSLYQMAANLLPHDDLTEALGDVYYFKPGRHSYIARKIEISASETAPVARPSSFLQADGDRAIAMDLIRECWGFCDRLMRALAPAGEEPADTDMGFRAVVQQLKYGASSASHEALFRMVRNSLGPWGRIGYSLDRQREEMCGPFGRRGISDTLALLQLIPFFRPPIRWLNRAAGRFDERSRIPDGRRLLVKAHIDNRYFSALCGMRHNLQTEILVDRRWLPLPINCDDIAVLPGSRATEAFGIEPTVHRILQTDGEPDDAASAAIQNLTLLLGAK